MDDDTDDLSFRLSGARDKTGAGWPSHRARERNRKRNAANHRRRRLHARRWHRRHGTSKRPEFSQ